MQYRVTIRDESGRRQSAIREAAGESEAVAALRREGAIVLSIVPLDTLSETEPSGRRRLPPVWHPSWLKPVSKFDIELGLEQIASMLKSGVPLVESLDTVAEQMNAPRCKRIWHGIHDDVLSGKSLSAAMHRHGGFFSAAVIALVKVGEETGELDKALHHAAQQLEAGRNLRSMVVNALAYPIFAIAAVVGVCAFLVIGVIPKIADFLESSGGTLPPMTQSLVDIAGWLNAHGGAILAAIVAMALLIIAARMMPRGRLAFDSMLLRIPAIGFICRLSGTAVFARAMEMLTGSGVPLLESLDVSRGLLGNMRLRSRVDDAYKSVLNGGEISSPLRTGGDFMPMLPQMTAVGEKSGTLPESFGEVARFHETLLAHTIKRFGAIFEPVLILATGGIVGYVYIAFFLALFSMAEAA